MKQRAKYANRKKLAAIAVSAVLCATTMGTTLSAFADVAEYVGGKFTSVSTNGYEAYDESGKMNVRVMEEGITLLKHIDDASGNKVLPLSTSGAAKPKISVFGKNSVNPVYGGSGSAGGTGTGSCSLLDGLEHAGFDVNPTLVKFYNDNKASGAARGSIGMGTTWSKGLGTAETPQAKYTDDVKASYDKYDDAAIIVISRIGGEGFELPRQSVGVEGRSNPYEHYFVLDDNEEALIDAVTAKFDKVIVLVNTPTQMELGPIQKNNKIQDVLWVGCPGTTGFDAVGRVLNGTVTPSGRTVDSWAADFTKDPTYYNLAKNDNIASKYDNYGTANQKVKDAYKSDAVDSTIAQLNTYGEVTNHYMDEAGEFATYHETAYEEGIYMGYRYYETRGYTESVKNGDDSWYAANMVYPFGHGLSYTTFTKTVTWKVNGNVNGTITDADDVITAEVTVTNTGNYSGKEVVQLYYSAPYIDGQIEKSHVVLGGFAKTDVIAPGKTDTVTITITARDMASYDWDDSNKNNASTYELDKGNYSLIISDNAHSWATAAGDLKKTYDYQGDVVVGIDTALEGMYTGNNTNQYDDVSAYFVGEGKKIGEEDGRGWGTELSRKDWEATWPAPPTKEELTKTQDYLDEMETRRYVKKGSGRSAELRTGDDLKTALATWDSADADWTRAWSDMYKADGTKASDADHTGLFREAGKEFTKANPAPIQLADMIDADYNDDAAWAPFLAQLTLSQMSHLISDSGFKITCPGYDALGMPYVTLGDGGTGYTRTGHDNKTDLSKGNTYCSSPMMAATWNYDLLVELGEKMGEEGIWLDMQGLYGPGTDLHRSPFGGRNFEYFAEDAYLAGKIAAAYVKGAQSKGVIPLSKHFFMNDTETNRDTEGLVTWGTEQTIREIYLKNAEIMIKDGGSMGFMTAFNRIGYKYLSSEDYRTLTDVVRNEWGFKGIFTTDAFNAYQDAYTTIRAGASLTLNMGGTGIALDGSDAATKAVVANSATTVYHLRKTVQQICYVMLRMNAMNKVTSYENNLNNDTNVFFVNAGDTFSEDVGSDTIKNAFKDDAAYTTKEYRITTAKGEAALTALGLTLNKDTGILSGTIASGTPDGLYDFEVGYYIDKGTDEGWLGWQTAAFEIVVGDLKSVDPNYGTARRGEPFEMYVQAGKGGANNNLKLVYKLGEDSELPAGLKLTEDGKLTGTPTAAGKFSFDVVATNADDNSESITTKITVYVLDYYGTITYNAETLPEATVGEFYIASVGTATTTANHGVTYSFVANAGRPGPGGPGGPGGGPGGPGGRPGNSNTLPAGLKITPNGIIYGIPTAASENAEFTVTASAAGYANATAKFALKINAAGTGSTPSDNTAITAINEKLAALETKITALETANADLTTVKADLAALKTVVEGLGGSGTTDLTEVNSKIAALEAKVAELEGKDGGCGSTVNLVLPVTALTLMLGGICIVGIIRKRNKKN